MPQTNPAHQGGQFRFYPMLDRAIARIVRQVVPARRASTRYVIMATAQLRLTQGGLGRRQAELQVLRYLMCETEHKSEVRHG